MDDEYQDDTSGLINCLRCHQCKLLPDTRMSDAVPMIWCEKKKARSPLILSGCGLAINRVGWTTPNGKKAGRRGKGDRTYRASEVEVAYVKQWYGKVLHRDIVKHTGRSRQYLSGFAKHHGIPVTEMNRENRSRLALKANIARQKKGQHFNQAQRDYMMARYRSGSWPALGGCNKPHCLPARYALQEEIAREVSALGRPCTWQSVKGFVARNAPSRLRKLESYWEARKEKQRHERVVRQTSLSN